MKQWNGEGLPPVGTECEWLASGDHDWVKVTVLGHNGDDTWLKPDDGTQSFVVGNAENFRPIQTERTRSVEQMFYDLPEGKRPGIDIREAIYDAGYRKTPDLVDGYDVHHWSSLAKERFHQFNALETETIAIRKMIREHCKSLKASMKQLGIAYDDI